MITLGELRDLERRLRNRKVLSVFVDTSAIASAKRFGWREDLNRALARLEVRPPQLSSGERTARELCMAHLRTLLEGTVQRLGEDPRATRLTLRPPRVDSAPVTASLAASG